MDIAIENLPIIFLIIIGMGVTVIVISVICLAGINESSQNYYVAGGHDNENEDSVHLQELFSFFLEEEEKKNEQFREMMLGHSRMEAGAQLTKNERSKLAEQMKSHKKTDIDQNTFNEIIRRFQMGEDAQSIAKSLKKGVGEVKLIISLYSMQ